MENQELRHHGILGMKWGVRRTPAQLGHKPSGNGRARDKARSITDAANERVRKIKARGRAQSRVAKAEERAAAKIAKAENKSKSISEMSDAEIRNRINRIRMENELKSLSPQQVSKGKQFISSIMNDVIGPAARDAGKRLATDFFQKKGAELLGLNKKDVEDAATKLQKEVSYLSNLQKKDVLTKYFDDKQRKADAEAKAKTDAKNAKKQANKEAKEAEKQANKEAKEAEKQANKEAKEAEKQAEKAAKVAEKQAEQEAKEARRWTEAVEAAVKAAEKAANKQSSTEYADVTIERDPSSTARKTNSSNRRRDVVIDAEWSEVTVDDASRSSSTTRGRNYVESLLRNRTTRALPYNTPTLPYKEED